MKTRYAERIILIGPMGSGKSAVAAQLAHYLNWPVIETDQEIVRAAGRTIPEIFASEGEAGFRERERLALVEAITRRGVIISTGGGITEHPENVELMREHGWIVFLDAQPETSLERVRAEARGSDPASLRPLLAGGDPLARLRELYERRRPSYTIADQTIATNDLSAPEAAATIAGWLIGHGRLSPEGATASTTTVLSARGEYDVHVAWGGLATLPDHLREMRLPPRVHIVTDTRVGALFESSLCAILAAAGFEPDVHTVPAGEQSKSRSHLDGIHDWLAERRAERTEALLALGGGVVGDLAGFAAATYLRGIPLIQIPTSLLAQVDASIGGKVAIDHPRGKNLIGAFYPPRLVLTDPAVLLTLPDRSLREGWAEVVKHGVALDAAYFARIEEVVDALLRREPRALTEIIAGSVAIKGGVVSEDERESENGRRQFLNYGHTVGHAIEAVTGYGNWLHGEAVAAGMAFAARLGARAGVTPPELIERQERLLTRFDLPTRIDGLSVSAIMSAALWDKKVRGGRVRWIVPLELGTSAILDRVPDADVRQVLLELGSINTDPPQARARI
jgi:3-dehydroquinate synthase